MWDKYDKILYKILKTVKPVSNNFSPNRKLPENIVHDTQYHAVVLHYREVYKTKLNIDKIQLHTILLFVYVKRQIYATTHECK